MSKTAKLLASLAKGQCYAGAATCWERLKGGDQRFDDWCSHCQAVAALEERDARIREIENTHLPKAMVDEIMAHRDAEIERLKIVVLDQGVQIGRCRARIAELNHHVTDLEMRRVPEIQDARTRAREEGRRETRVEIKEWVESMIASALPDEAGEKRMLRMMLHHLHDTNPDKEESRERRADG